MSENLQTAAALLRWGAAQIQTVSQSAALDASLLLAYALEKSREELILSRDEIVDQKKREQFTALIERRKTGEPIAYLIEKKSFWLYDFYVNPAVLIPKPDTELLVEKALEVIKKALGENPAKTHTDKNVFTVADICTGSGCVALSLLASFNAEPFTARSLSVIASDISPQALEVAQKNAASILSEITRDCLRLVKADLLDSPEFRHAAERGGFDLIVSNPPYVPSRIARELLTDGRCEPLLALDGGDDGLDLIRSLIPQVFTALKSGGIFFLETGEYNAGQTRELLTQSGFVQVKTFNDLSGSPRVSTGLKP